LLKQLLKLLKSLLTYKPITDKTTPLPWLSKCTSWGSTNTPTVKTANKIVDKTTLRAALKQLLQLLIKLSITSKTIADKQLLKLFIKQLLKLLIIQLLKLLIIQLLKLLIIQLLKLIKLLNCHGRQNAQAGDQRIHQLLKQLIKLLITQLLKLLKQLLKLFKKQLLKLFDSNC